MIDRVPFTSLLSNIVDNRGRTCPTSNTGIALIATNCVKNSYLYPVFEKVRHVGLETYKSWFRGHPIPGDLIFVCKGSPGQVCLTPDPVNFCIAQDMVAVRADVKKVYPLYLFAALRSNEVQRDIENMHVGTLIPHFKKGDFSKLSIPLPSPEHQKFIGDWHFGIENKIELNRRMNETLEGMAQAIFKDWFVDFGPTRRKLSGITDPVAIMGGLTPDAARATELAALFPDALGDDGLPVGWKKATLEEIATLNDESWKASNHPAAVEYVDLSNTKWGVIENTVHLAWAEAPSRARRIARRLDTIVGTVRPGNGSFSFIARDGYTVSTGFAVLRPRIPTYAEVLYVAATSEENIKRLANLADSHGGAYPAVNPDVVLQTEINFGGRDLLVAASSFMGPMRQKIEQAKLENTALAETRDYLLPKLMSGEVRVRDADQGVTL